MTVIEAVLDRQAEHGVMLAHADRRRSRAGPKVDLQKDGSVSVANVAGTGPSTAGVEAVATPAVQAAMAACERHGLVLAGNAAGELPRQAAAERQGRDMDGLGGKLAGWMADKAAEGLKDNPGSVSTELQYLLLDPAALERQLDLVVTVADEFEAAMGDTAEAG